MHLQKPGYPFIDFIVNIEKEVELVLHLGEKAIKNDILRSKLIVLFSELEALRCLYVAYNKKTTSKSDIKNASDENMEQFIKKFLLNSENNWVKENPDRASKISARNIVDLRNSLTHFFSVSKKLQICSYYNEKAKKGEKKTNNKTKFITPDDLYEMMRGGFEIIISKWSNDCLEEINNKKETDFKERIECVLGVVKEHGCVFCE